MQARVFSALILDLGVFSSLPGRRQLRRSGPRLFDVKLIINIEYKKRKTILSCRSNQARIGGAAAADHGK